MKMHHVRYISFFFLIWIIFFKLTRKNNCIKFDIFWRRIGFFIFPVKGSNQKRKLKFKKNLFQVCLNLFYNKNEKNKKKQICDVALTYQKCYRKRSVKYFLVAREKYIIWYNKQLVIFFLLPQEMENMTHTIWHNKTISAWTNPLLFNFT